MFKPMKIIVLIALILIITVIAFLPALKNGFNYDDDLYLRENSFIRSLSFHNCKKIFTSFFVGNYQPLSILTYSLEYNFFRLNPFSYHITNLILHLLNCLLVFWLFYLLGGSFFVAFITGILFAVHPLRVESVAWISERKDVLYAFFSLGALIAYVHYLREKNKPKFYCLVLFLFLLSLLSKSMAVTFPLLLFLFDYFLCRKPDKTMFLEKIPFFILSLLFGVTAILSQYSGGGIRQEGSLQLANKFMNAAYGIIFYLHKIFLPTKLACLYPFPDTPTKLLSMIFFVSLILFILVFLRKTHSRKAFFCCGFFLITILPVLQLIPLGSTLVADRYSYIPSLGIYYLIAEVFVWLYSQKNKYAFFARVFLVIVLMAAIGVLSMLTWKRCKVWKDGIVLWSDVLRNYPSFVTALNNRGCLFRELNEHEKAVFDFKRALSINSDYKNSRYIYLNLGNLYRDMGRRQEAIDILQDALKMSPDDAEIFFNLGEIYSDINKQEARRYYKKAIKLDSSHVKACYNLGILNNDLGDKEDAISMFKKTTEIDPFFLPAYVKLAYLYNIVGNKEGLEVLYKKAVENELELFQAYYYIGDLYERMDKYRDAESLYKKALKINPRFTQAYIKLGGLYCVTGKIKESILSFNKALELNPNLAVAYNGLAVSYYYDKRYGLAIKYCDKAVELGYQVEPKLLNWLKAYRAQERKGRF